MTIARPALRYHGGKFRLAPWILSFFPPHRAYVEPYGGAASVLLLKARVEAECYNDADGNVVNLFRILRDPATAAELRRRIELTAYARDEFNWSYAPPVDPLDAAHKLLVRSFMGHGSDSTTRACRTGFRAKLSEMRSLPASDWRRWPDAIPSFVDRLRGVVIENRDAREVIERMDSRETLFYIDPPYPHSTRSALLNRAKRMHGYAHEMTDDDHRQLARQLRRVRGMVVLSGYACQLYDGELYADWQRHERRHLADGARPRTEVLWLNKACVDALACSNVMPQRPLRLSTAPMPCS